MCGANSLTKAHAFNFLQLLLLPDFFFFSTYSASECFLVLFCLLSGSTSVYMEEEMATHSSVLAWRIPWTEEPVGLPSMGSHRVGHD